MDFMAGQRFHPAACCKINSDVIALIAVVQQAAANQRGAFPGSIIVSIRRRTAIEALLRFMRFRVVEFSIIQYVQKICIFLKDQILILN
jgi:hypothetical protein